MKKLMIVLVLAGLGFMGVGQNVVNNRTIYNLDQFVNDCLKELGVDSVMINIQNVNGLVYGKYPAVCYKAGDTFMIGISNTLFYGASLNAIAHELVHVKQISKGELRVLGSDNIEFNSIAYLVSTDSHFNDPQEVEARKIGEKLYNQFRPNYIRY